MLFGIETSVVVWIFHLFNIVIKRVHEIVIKVITVIVDGYIVEMCHVFDTVYTLSELEKVEIVEL